MTARSRDVTARYRTVTTRFELLLQRFELLPKILPKIYPLKTADQRIKNRPMFAENSGSADKLISRIFQKTADQRISGKISGY